MLESIKFRDISQGESPEGNNILTEKEKKNMPYVILKRKMFNLW